MARVNVSVNVRDMTGGDLARLRQRFNRLGDSMNRFAGNGSQRNLAQMRDRFGELDERVRGLAGHIPDDEFRRLTARTREFGDQINTVTGPATQQRLGAMRQSLRNINTELNRFPTRRTVRINARDDTDGGLQSVRRRITRFALGPMRGLGGLIGGTLSDGIGQGLVGAFRSPAFGAVIVAALVAALSVVGAALAGVIVLAVAGAFVGLGVFMALQAEGVKDRWANTLAELKPLFADAARPMIPVIDDAREKFNSMAREFAPHFKEALERAAPILEDFLTATKDGFRKMGQHAWDDLQEAFRVFVEAFGPQWEDFLKEFGKSLGALARTVSEHSTEMAIALRGVLGVINLIIDTINFFARVWVFNVRLMIDSIEFFGKIMAIFTDVILGFFEDILGAAVVAFGWIPGVGDKLREARKAFGLFREDLVGKLNNISDNARKMGERLDTANKRRRLEVDIAGWQRQLIQAKKDLNTVPKERRAQVQANIDNLTWNIDRARDKLNNLKKDWYVRIHAYRVGDWATNPGGGGPYAHGGVVGQAATGGVRSNMTMVGERGPEIVNLPPGSHVKSNPDTRRMLGAGESSGGASTIILKSSGRRADDMLIEMLREAIHQRGGDPVKVLRG